MKLTRMFILKAFDEDNKNYDNDDPINSLKRLMITNANIDVFILLILSLLYIISLGFINKDFYKIYPINFIVFVKLIIFFTFLLVLVEFLRITIIIWEKYLRSLNKPQNFSEKSSLNSNKSRDSVKSNDSKNSNINLNKNRIEMDDLDNKKSPFLPKKEKKEVNDNNIENSKNYIFEEGNKFNIINQKKNYIEYYYESILSSPNNSFYDKIIIKIYISLIKKLNKLINEENFNDINKKQKKISLYQIIIKYPHIISSIFHFLKNILFLLNFGFSFTFWILYSSLRPELKNYSFNRINIFIGECLDLYTLFRLCFFLIKIILNILLIPLYISAIYLGYYEDQFNAKLNDLIKTRFYTGKNCLISRDSINKVNENEIDETCAICIYRYINGDVISTLPCSKRHSFHTYCLEEWFRTNVSCPLCRCDFSNEIGIYLPNNEQNENNNNNNINNNDFNNNQQFINFIIPNNIINGGQENNFLINNINIINNENANNNINLGNNQNNFNEQENPRQNFEMRELNNNENNNVINANNSRNNNN